jgi:putative tricarboxylic transport membrane protein
MQKGEVALSAVCVAFFSFMLTQAYALHGVGRFGEVGSGFWPLLSLAASTLLSVIWLISNVLKYARQQGKSTEDSTPEDNAAAWSRRRKVGLSLACLLVYIVALPWIGFIVSSVLFILAFVLVLDERRKSVLIISPVLIPAVIIIVFGKFITMPLPKGVGVFAAFSRLFY